MQIVIDIPKYIFDMIKATKEVIRADAEIVGEAILNGTPLPKEKTGKWIKYCTPIGDEQHYQCTNCKWYINFGQYGDIYTKQFKFCPNCGARMVSE